MQYVLIIDGNYALSINVYALFKDNKLFGRLAPALKESVGKLKKLHVFKKCYLVSDAGRSWRKDFYPAYKATRKKDDNIDWKFVFNTYNDFKNYAQEDMRIQVLETFGVEGDDWVAHLVKKYNSKGVSCLIVSSDKDLLQLIQCQTGDIEFLNIMLTMEQYNSKIYLPNNWEILATKYNTNENSLFGLDNQEDIEQFVYNLKNNRKTELVEAEEKLFCKVVGGDKQSDNIESVFIKNSRGIGNAGAIKLYQCYKQQYPEPIQFYTKDFVIKAAMTVAEDKKETSEEVIKLIEKNVVRNLKLVALEDRFLPKDLKESMQKYCPI